MFQSPLLIKEEVYDVLLKALEFKPRLRALIAEANLGVLEERTYAEGESAAQVQMIVDRQKIRYRQVVAEGFALADKEAA